jgi:hypothetical protein
MAFSDKAISGLPKEDALIYAQVPCKISFARANAAIDQPLVF